MATNPNGSLDWISVSGYMGGNLNYDPAIPKGATEVDYYKNAYDIFGSNITKMQTELSVFYSKTKKVFTSYFYDFEGTKAQKNLPALHTIDQEILPTRKLKTFSTLL